MSSTGTTTQRLSDDPYTAVPDAAALHAAAAAAAAAEATSADAAAAATTLKMAPEGDRVAAALARMQASRARLRTALVPPAAAGGGSGGHGGSGFSVSNIARLLWRQVRGGFRKSPSLDLVAQTVQTWWRRQPWHSAASLAGGEVQQMVVPMVRSHPWRAVAVAAAVGAAVVVAKPWRWSLVTGQARKLRSEAFRLVRNQVFHVPLQMLLASLASLLVVQASGGDDGAAGQADATPPPRDDGLAPVEGVSPGV